MIPVADPHAQYLAHAAEIDAAIRRVLDSGRYVLGPECEAFEKEFAAFAGVQHAVGVGNGTDAVHVALRACGIGAGDEVITVSHTAVATVAAIELCGATPVLVDIDPIHFTMDPDALAAAFTSRTRAVIPVHIYGQPADLRRIVPMARERGVFVIEDCAQAHGATFEGRPVGSWGDLACFSFYPTKNLGAIGDGGLVATNDPQLADRARRFREYGWSTRYVSATTGTNSRLDELQAAVLRVKLAYLSRDNVRRQAIATIYDRALASLDVVRPSVRPDATHVYHLYVVRSAQRDALQQALAQHRVGSAVHYPVPVHLQPAYQSRLKHGDLSQTERAAGEVLSLPMFPELSREDVERVCEAVAKASA
jgi:dTDP-4-amino-4,6-dideoxygalactose transaminase